MKFEFEGKNYATMAQIHREWFPTRSPTWVSICIKAGCKTVAEVVSFNVKREQNARKQVLKNARTSIYKATNASVARTTK